MNHGGNLKILFENASAFFKLENLDNGSGTTHLY